MWEENDVSLRSDVKRSVEDVNDSAEERRHVDDGEGDEQSVEQRVAHRRLAKDADEDDVADQAAWINHKLSLVKQPNSNLLSLISKLYHFLYTSNNSNNICI